MKRLPGGPEYYFRTTDHSEEIAWLRRKGGEESDDLRRLAYLVAAELLACHDASGISLDDWDAPRDLVEFMLQRNILPNNI